MRKEVREGRSFNPDEFAIHLEQVIARTAPEKTTPPGTESLARIFQAAGGPVLLLFDEVLNFLNRHRDMADQFHAFIQNLTVATTGTTQGAAVISLPRSQVEMTEWDMQWQDKITKLVRRVAKDLIANDETEISEVVRRRLFEDIGSNRVRKNICKAYADWCFDRRAQLPPEWTAVDSTTTEAKSREYLRKRFEVCYPFHPATLSVFQRKWQALSQYQQTRGTLAMLAQWISWAYRTGFTEARREPVITLGSAPLDVPELRFALGEPDVDKTSVDNAAFALEDKSYFIRRVCSDGFKISHQPTMKKVVNDRRASLDEDTEIKPAMRSLVQKEFGRGASIPIVPFPADGSSVQDTPRLTLVMVDPDSEWTGSGTLRNRIAEWTRQLGKSPRLYPGSLAGMEASGQGDGGGNPGRRFRPR